MFHSNRCQFLFHRICKIFSPNNYTKRKSEKEGDVCSYGFLLLEMFTGRRSIDNMIQDGHTLRNFVKTSLLE